jgi:hypothetical protein
VDGRQHGIYPETAFSETGPKRLGNDTPLTSLFDHFHFGLRNLSGWKAAALF